MFLLGLANPCQKHPGHCPVNKSRPLPVTHQSCPFFMPVKSSSRALGAWAELVAAEMLLAMGYEVFRNVAQTGPHDLAVRHLESGKFTAVDVTFGRYSAAGSLNSNALSKLRSGCKDAVLVVTERRELLHATLDVSKGLVFQGKNGYPAAFEIVTSESLK